MTPAVQRQFEITMHGHTITVVDNTNHAQSLEQRGIMTKLTDAAALVVTANPAGSGNGNYMKDTVLAGNQVKILVENTGADGFAKATTRHASVNVNWLDSANSNFIATALSMRLKNNDFIVQLNYQGQQIMIAYANAKGNGRG